MKLRTTVQISSAVQKKPTLKREDSFLKRFSTRQTPEAHETTEDVDSGDSVDKKDKIPEKRNIYLQRRQTVVNPDERFYFNWLMVLTCCVLYNFWTLIVRESFPELQDGFYRVWVVCDGISDFVFVLDIVIQLRTGYLEQGLMVYQDKKLAMHYFSSRMFMLDVASLLPLDLLQSKLGQHPLLRFPRFFKIYRTMKFYYIVESRTVWPNLWRVINLIHILLILAHWFGCFYFLLSEAEGFQGDWVYPYRPGDFATLSRKYLGSLYWSTLTLTTIGDLPTPETNVEHTDSADGPRSLPRRGLNTRLLRVKSCSGFIFTILSYLIGVFIFATIVGQVGNVITNRNANRLEFERLLDGAKTYMRHHKVPGEMKRRVLRWYDYSWSRGRIQGGGDINKALGLLPDKLKTELALHVNLTVLKKVTIFQECQPEFLHDLVLKMKAYIFTPGDSICRRGEVAREMFIIADGILEVLSETGKVLTTMKAGDFFGEIGILNLDGFNKRTADVRSIGYSELFSLSRDDVLAAMKDYPEAEEILQEFGRRRLMEIKRINKRSQKNVRGRESLQRGQSVSAENATKNFVKKFKTDIKGIISSRKLRKSGPSNESLELEPLRSRSTKQRSKGFLQRSQRVNSNDLSTSDNQFGEKLRTTNLNSPEQAASLHRLCDLKEGKTLSIDVMQSRKSSGQNDADTSSPEKSTEVIGQGLSLIQRILLLKAKNEQEALRKAAAHESTSPPPPTITTIDIGSPPGSISSAREIQFKADVINSDQPIEEIAPPLHLPVPTPSGQTIEKPTPKYSFKKLLLNDKQSKAKSTILSAALQKTAETTIDQFSEKPVTISEMVQQNTANWKTRYQKCMKNLQPKPTWLPLIDEVGSKTRSLSLDTFSQVNSHTKPSHTKAAFRRHSDTTSFFLQKIDSKCSLKDAMQQQQQQAPSRDRHVSPISSPETNETVERKQLKSILKKMSRSDRESDEAPSSRTGRIRRLIREPTTEGYFARHSTLMKSVTFTSACSSPHVISQVVDSSENLAQHQTSPLSDIDIPVESADLSDNGCLEQQQRNQSIEKCDRQPFLCNCQTLTGSEEAYLNDITLNIRKVVQQYTCDLQYKFQSRIEFLESEIRRRDEIIQHMQKIIDDATVEANSRRDNEVDFVSWKHLTESPSSPHTVSPNSLSNQDVFPENQWQSRSYSDSRKDESLDDSSDQDSEKNWKSAGGYRILKASLDGTLRSTSSLNSENSIQSIGHYSQHNEDVYDSPMCVVQLEHNKILTCDTIFDSNFKDQGTKPISYDTTTITTTSTATSTTTTTTTTIDEPDDLTIRQSTAKNNTDQS